MKNITDMEVWYAVFSYISDLSLSWNQLGQLTGYPKLCAQAAQGEYRILPTDFLRNCVDVFVKTATRAKFEDTADSLSDTECREHLTERLRTGPTGCECCNYRQTCEHKPFGK